MKKIKSKNIYLLKKPNFYDAKKSQDIHRSGTSLGDFTAKPAAKTSSNPANASATSSYFKTAFPSTPVPFKPAATSSSLRQNSVHSQRSPEIETLSDSITSTFFKLSKNQILNETNQIKFNRKEWDQLKFLFLKMKKMKCFVDLISVENENFKSISSSGPSQSMGNSSVSVRTLPSTSIPSSISSAVSKMSSTMFKGSTPSNLLNRSNEFSDYELNSDEKELKKMVEKLHDFLLKKRIESKWIWSENLFELLMFYHILLKNYRAVKRLFEEYQKDYNPFASSEYRFPIQYYLFALWKFGNIDFFVSFVSKYFKELSSIKLTAQTYSIILKVANQVENRNMFQNWYSVLKRELFPLGNQSSEKSINSFDHTILHKALDYSSVFNSPNLSMEIFGDLKKYRRSFVKLKNINNSMAVNPIEMAQLFEKSIRAYSYPSMQIQTELNLEKDTQIGAPANNEIDQALYPDIKSENESGTSLSESEITMLANFRKWHSPLMPIPQLCSALRVLAHQKNSEKLYSFFQEQVCSREYLFLHWARQVSIAKKRIVDIIVESQQALDSLKLNQETDPKPSMKMSTKNWLENVPVKVRQSQVKESQDKQTLKSNISWAHRRLKRKIQVPVLVGEEGPLIYTYQTIIESWRASNVAEKEGTELELDNLLKRLVQLETDLVQSLPIAEFLSLKTK